MDCGGPENQKPKEKLLDREGTAQSRIRNPDPFQTMSNEHCQRMGKHKYE
jgi:hypothetical protein